MSQELFIINNIALRVNPTDIQVFDQRFADSVSSIRDISTYSVSSTAAIATYVVTMAFDLDIESDVKRLVSLCAQLEKYPFVFIKSERLAQFVPTVSRSITDYGMYAVKEWSIKHDYKAKNAIFITIDMHYFNHVPYIKDFSFLTYEKSEKSNSRIKVDKKQLGVELRTVSDLSESEIFSDYFYNHTANKQKKFDAIMDKVYAHDESGEVIFGRPRIFQAVGEFAEAPYKIIQDNIVTSGFEDEDVKLISYVNTFKANKDNEENQSLNFWMVYQDMPLAIIKDGLSKTFEVQSITVTKKNSIATNQLQMYKEPYIQFLGKSPAVMNIEMSINNSEFEYGDMTEENIKPYELLAQSLREAEQMHVVNGNKMPFKSLRVRSLANVLTGSKYFILENETSFESADDQGRQGVSINFVESDLTDMVGRSNLSLASTSLSEADMYPMIDIGAQLLEMYAAMEILPRPKSSVVSKEAQNDILFKQQFSSVNPNDILAERISRLTPLSENEKTSILVSGTSGVENIHSIVASIYAEAQTFLRNGTDLELTKPASYRKGLIDTAAGLRKLSAYAKKHRDDNSGKLDLTSENFRRLFGAISIGIELMLEGSVDAGLFRVSIKDPKDGEESRYIDVYKTIVKKGYEALSIKVLNGKFNEIKGEAILDMEIYSSLIKGYADKNNVNATEDYLGESDPRRFSPFFFISQDTYMDSTTLISIADAVDEFGKDQFTNENIIKYDGDTISSNLQDDLYIQGDDGPKYETAEQTKTKRKKTKKQKDIKSQIERIQKYTDLTMERYNNYIQKHSNDKIVNQYKVTRSLVRLMLTIESGGDPNAVNEENKLYFGLFQLSATALNQLYKGASAKWNDPITNIDAAIKFWHTYVIPELISKNSSALKIDRFSHFNFYMVHQQGGRGYRAVVAKYSNPATRYSRASSSYTFEGSNRNDYRNMSQNYPGKLKNWDGTYNSWIEAWKNKYYKVAGAEGTIFDGSNAKQLDKAGAKIAEALDLTKGIRSPSNMQLAARITKKTADSTVHVTDGDTFTFYDTKFDIVQEGDVKIANSSLRILSIDTPETKHAAIGGNQKYSKDALAIARSILSKMKYPISIYTFGKTVDGRALAVVMDSNGSDYSYEMIRNGLSHAPTSSDKLLLERFDLYNDIYKTTKTILNLDNYETALDARQKKAAGGEHVGKTNIVDMQEQILKRFGSAFDAIPEELSTIERAQELAKKTTETEIEELRPTDGILTRPLKRSAPFISKENINLFNEEIQKQFRCMRTGAHISTGLDMAVPTVKVYVVEGLRDDWLGRYDIALPRETNLYEVTGLVEVKIQTADEMNPVSVASLSVLNPGSIYTDLAALTRRGLNVVDFTGNNLETSYRDKMGKLRLTAGTRIHIRIGYSNDPNDLETIFNGEITEIEGEDLLDIVAEGYGRELIALDQQEEGVGYTEAFFGNATSTSVIYELLQKDELYHFGKRTHVANSVNPVATNILKGLTIEKVDANGGGLGVGKRVWEWFRDLESLLGQRTSTDINGLILGDWWKVSSELYTNVYSQTIQSIDDEFNGLYSFSRLASFYKSVTVSFPIYQATLWESLREILYRHPGTMLSVMNYKERSSLFYGIKEQLYIATDPPISMFTGSSDEGSTFNPEVEKIKYKMVKPASDFHLITSERDIISNEISLSAGFKTKVDVRYFGTGLPGRPDAEQFETNNGFGFFSSKLDDNLRSNAIRSTTLFAKSCDGEAMAWRYGVSELKRQAEMMYSGKIVVVGNPYMKAGDYAYLNDSFRGLTGIIKIRECSHIFTEKDGYVTVIVPGLYVEPKVFMYSYLYTKLGLTMSIAANKIKTDAATRFYDSRKIIYTSSILGVLADPKARDAYFGSSLSGEAAMIAYNGATIGFGYLALRFAIPHILRLLVTGVGVGTVTTLVAASAALNAIGGASAAGLFSGGSLVGRVFVGGLVGGARGLVGSLGFLSRFAASTPAVVIGAGILMLYLYQSIEKSNMTRQPLILLPLLNNGIAYQTGLFGYAINNKWDSLAEEIGKTGEAASKLLRAARSRWISTAPDDRYLYESARYKTLLSYLKTVNGNASTDAFFGRKENPNK